MKTEKAGEAEAQLNIVVKEMGAGQGEVQNLSRKGTQGCKDTGTEKVGRTI